MAARQAKQSFGMEVHGIIYSAITGPQSGARVGVALARTWTWASVIEKDLECCSAGMMPARALDIRADPKQSFSEPDSCGGSL
jgi:hypothetical protein